MTLSAIQVIQVMWPEKRQHTCMSGSIVAMLVMVHKVISRSAAQQPVKEKLSSISSFQPCFRKGATTNADVAVEAMHDMECRPHPLFCHMVPAQTVMVLLLHARSLQGVIFSSECTGMLQC